MAIDETYAFTSNRPNTVRIRYANGYSISIVFHEFSYSDKGRTAAEVAVFDPLGDFYRLPGERDDVVGWCTPERVLAIQVKVALL